jgi:hypothetical protein
MVFAAAKAAEVDNHGDDQDKQIDSRKRLVAINHPRVNQSCEWQENESKQRDNQPVVSVLKIIRQEKDEQERNPGKSHEQNDQNTRHRNRSPFCIGPNG